ncbi:MAG: xanthine dehydrogenase family protein subunit M [Candidatus Velthaea sp.]
MKPQAFAYVRAGSIDDVFAYFERYGEDAKLIAGGQSLVPAMNMRLAAPAVLIDIATVPGLNRIDVVDGHLHIGALVTHRDIEGSAAIAEHAPLLAAAVRHIAHPAIRACGTFGGTMAHADPSAEFPACALALQMEFEISGRSGTRLVPAHEFFRGLFETDISPGEILVRVHVPAIAPSYRSVFLEFARRQGDYAIAGIALHGRIAEAARSDLRIAYFGVDGKPVLALRAAAELEGTAMNDDVALHRAQDRLDAELDPPGDHIASRAYRLHLAKVLLERAVRELCAHAGPS